MFRMDWLAGADAMLPTDPRLRRPILEDVRYQDLVFRSDRFKMTKIGTNEVVRSRKST